MGEILFFILSEKDKALYANAIGVGYKHCIIEHPINRLFGSCLKFDSILEKRIKLWS